MKSKKLQLVVLGIGLFLMISGMVESEFTMNFDKTGLALIFSLRNPLLTKMIVGITYLGNWQTIVFLCLVFLTMKRTRLEWGLPLSLAAAFSTIMYKLIKTLYERPRPDIGSRLIEQGGFSFPSGHAMTGLVFYGLLIYLCLKYGYKKSAQRALVAVLVSLIFMIGLSRLYLGLHYPTDVLAGWCLGVSILAGAITLLEKRLAISRLEQDRSRVSVEENAF